MNEALIKELKAWMTFYKAGSVGAKTEKDQQYNSGCVDGIKTTLDLLVKYRLISEQDKQQIY